MWRTQYGIGCCYIVLWVLRCFGRGAAVVFLGKYFKVVSILSELLVCESWIEREAIRYVLQIGDGLLNNIIWLNDRDGH